jgi:hypothetical protein
MRKNAKKGRRTLDRKLAQELTAEELRRLNAGGGGTISCSRGVDDD